MIAVDTGPLVALLDRSDNQHKLCKTTLEGLKEPLITTWAALTEAHHLLGFSVEVQRKLVQLVADGDVAVHLTTEREHSRLLELADKYADLPLDLADATLVSMCEQLRIKTVFTLDMKDFTAIRPRHARAFTVIPRRG